MLLRNHPDRIQISFDNHRLVTNAGLLLPATLARHLGLRELVDHHHEPGGAPGGVCTLGGTVKAPSTLLRGFRWGPVCQLDRLSRELLAWACQAGARPGDGALTPPYARPADWPRRGRHHGLPRT